MAPAPKHSFEEQEALILSAAGQVIEESSLLDFTMSKIAKAAGISMGSIYKHVQSKEDVLIALAVKVQQNLLGIFERIYKLELTMPEKLIAGMMLDYSKINLYSFDCQLDMLVNNEAFIQRASKNWLLQMQISGNALESYNYDRIIEAMQSGELIAEISPSACCPDFLAAQERGEDLTPMTQQFCANELNVGMWALHVGAMQVMLQKHAIAPNAEDTALIPAESLACAQTQNYKRYINSFKWSKPLDDEGILRAIAALEVAGLR